MRRPLQTLLFAALLLAPASLLAQDVLPQPIADGDQLYLTGLSQAEVAAWGGVMIGPYDGEIHYASGDPTHPQVTLYCVDYFDDVSLGNHWPINVSSLAGPSPDLSQTLVNDVDKYKEAAFLASLFDAASTFTALHYDATHAYGTTQYVYSGIHAAIWRIMTGGVFPGANALALKLSSQFYDIAEYFKSTGFDVTQLPTGFAFTGFDEWSVLTDTGDHVNNHPGQEYLVRTTTVTPEPATYVMLLTGLLLVFGVARLRRKEPALA